MLISSLPWQYTSAEESNVVYLLKHCQSKQEINQYLDASQNVIFYNIKPKLWELTAVFLLIPNMYCLYEGNALTCTRDGRKNRETFFYTS